MRSIRFHWVLALLLTPAVVPEAHAQMRDWQAYTSLREVLAVDASDVALWAATSGGVYAYIPSSGEVTRYTPVQGLHGVKTATLVYDSRRDAVWIGYDDGVIDRLDVASGTVTAFFDIARADQYTERAVRRLRLEGDTLFAATAFGLVVFDTAREEVRETYARFADLDPATPVNDVVVAPLPGGAAPGLWVATDAGVVYAPLGAPNLQQPSAWTVDEAAPAASGCLALFIGQVHACGSGGAYRRSPDGTWPQTVFAGVPARDLLVDGGHLYAPAGSSLIRVDEEGRGRTYRIAGFDFPWAVAAGPDGALWLGDRLDGLLRLPALGPDFGGVVDVAPAQVVIPPGPFSNVVNDVAVGPGGAVWLAHRRIQNLAGDAITAISWLDAEGWHIRTQLDSAVPPNNPITAAVSADGTFYSAVNGSGLVEITPDGATTAFDETNSTLQKLPGFDLIEMGDALPGADGLLWVTNPGTPLPLHVRSAEGVWRGLPYPPGMPTSINLRRIAIDEFGQKWFTARQNSANQGAGVVAISTGADPQSGSDDQARHFGQVGTNGTFLPSEDVTSLAFDGDGRLWIGTRRGLAVIFEPGAALSGDGALAIPQWTRTADGADYLLRDLNVNDLAVDPSGQIWIASTTGAWLLNAAGDAVALELTAENTPLFSSNVVAVTVDEASGRVYFATTEGLLSAVGEATAPATEVRELSVAPSPYRPDVHARGVLISGLVAETTVFVLTPDGRRIAALDARGGSVRWDGRDEQTGTPVASGIYLVAAVAADGRETAIGKVAVIR